MHQNVRLNWDTLPCHSFYKTAKNWPFLGPFKLINCEKNLKNPPIFELVLFLHCFSYVFHSNFKQIRRLWNIKLVSHSFVCLLPFLQYYSFDFMSFLLLFRFYNGCVVDLSNKLLWFPQMFTPHKFYTSNLEKLVVSQKNHTLSSMGISYFSLETSSCVSENKEHDLT